MAYNSEGLHRRPPSTNKYEQTFGAGVGNSGDDESRSPFIANDMNELEKLLNDRHNQSLLSKRSDRKTGIGDALIGLIPIILLTMVMLFFLFAVLTVIKAFMTAHMSGDKD